MLTWRKFVDGMMPVILIIFSLVTVGCLYHWIKSNFILSGADEGLFTEIIGILITVFLIDRLRSLSERNRYRRNLIRQARSKSNPIAIDAIEIIRDEKWLDEKSIRLLEGKNLSGAALNYANLRKAYLNRTVLSHSTLEETDMRDSILTDVQFNGASLIRTRFSGANLAGASFIESSLEACQFKVDLETDENDAKLQDDEKKAVFEKSTLKDITFEGMSLKNISFKDAKKIQNVKFDRANLYGINFSGAHFERTSFIKSQLERADFRESNAQDIISFEGAKLHSAHIENRFFLNTKFNEAKLIGAHCNGVTFQGCDLRGTDFTAAILAGVKFNKVTFAGNTVMPDGETLKSMLDKCSDESSLDRETQFIKLIMTYLIDQIAVESIDDSYFSLNENDKIKLDKAEFRSPPKINLAPSSLDIGDSEDE